MESVDTVTENCVGDLSVKLESVRAPSYEEHCIDTGDDLASAECLEVSQRPAAEALLVSSTDSARFSIENSPLSCEFVFNNLHSRLYRFVRDP